MTESIKKVKKNLLFVKCFEPYDFTKSTGQLAIQISFTNGETLMLTTKSTKTNVFASFDFLDFKEFFDFVDFLKSNNVPKK